MVRVRVLHALSFGLVAALLAACPTKPPRSVYAGTSVFDLDEATKSLVIPPDDEASEALRQIGGQAKADDRRAAWVEIHYLVDLFDAARFEPDAEARDKSRRALFKALQVADATGPKASETAIDGILVKVDRLLGQDRLHAGALAARTLLEHDRAPAAPGDLFKHMLSLKAIARGDGPLAANAQLRLADFCRVAFRDAAQAPTPFRPGILAFCLYSLYDSDPAPYFDRDPSKRPPEPAWQDLASGTLDMLAGIGKLKSRIAHLGPAVGGRMRAFLDKNAGLYPTRRAPEDLQVPMVPRAEPYEWTPLVMLGDGSKPPAADLPATLTKLLSSDRRGRVAVAFTSTAPAAGVVTAAQLARQAGADGLEMVVGYAQTLKAPTGDYWHGRAKNDAVSRLGVIPLALNTTTDVGAVGGAAEARTWWDTSRSQLGLALVVGPTSWQLVSPTGALPEIPASAKDDPAAGLRAQLAMVRAAFPDEDGLVLVPDTTASYGQLVAAAVAAHLDANGKVLFDMLAIADKRPGVSGKPTLAARVALRASATVTITPDALGGRAGAVRQCYQDALDRDPKLGGVLSLELKQVVPNVAPSATVGAGGPKDKTLRTCVAQSLSPAMKDGNVATARVTLAVKK
jgi:hypothetical protein